MRVLMRVEGDQRGWRRCATDIVYGADRYGKTAKSAHKRGYTLSFIIKRNEIPTGGRAYLAYALPYTYNQLTALLEGVKAHPTNNTHRPVSCVTELAKSVGGLSVPLITITEPTDDPEELARRPRVVITARVHPGESVSSWVADGAISSLLLPEAAELRSNLIFEVVPMLNPDGVVAGNYRCTLAGLDLNRQWAAPNEAITPEIFALKQRLREWLAAPGGVLVFVDLHGHSRQRGAFLYGNNKQVDSVFADICEITAGSLFSRRKCKFSASKARRGTARQAVAKMGVRYSFTLEVSLGGVGREHWSASQLRGLGVAVTEAALILSRLNKSSDHPDNESSENHNPNNELCAEEVTTEIISQMWSQGPRLVQLYEPKAHQDASSHPAKNDSDSDNSDEGSDPNPCSDNADLHTLKRQWGRLLSTKPPQEPAPACLDEEDAGELSSTDYDSSTSETDLDDACIPPQDPCQPSSSLP